MISLLYIVKTSGFLPHGDYISRCRRAAQAPSPSAQRASSSMEALSSGMSRRESVVSRRTRSFPGSRSWVTQRRISRAGQNSPRKTEWSPCLLLLLWKRSRGEGRELGGELCAPWLRAQAGQRMRWAQDGKRRLSPTHADAHVGGQSPWGQRRQQGVLVAKGRLQSLWASSEWSLAAAYPCG